MGLQDTPRANRPHIGLFGNRNAGKSSLLNAITGQAKSLVSPVAGTTTDLVYQPFELERLGPVVFIDTAGLDDSGPLGTLRVEKTRQAVDTMDLAILVLTGPMKEELSWFQWLQEKKIPILPVLNQCDRMENVPAVQAYLSQQLGGLPVLPVSAKTGEQIPQLRQAIAQALPDDFWELTITGSLAQPGDLTFDPSAGPNHAGTFGQAMFRYELHGRLLGSNLGGPAHPPKVDYNRFPGFPFRLEGKTRGEPADLLLHSLCWLQRRHSDLPTWGQSHCIFD